MAEYIVDYPDKTLIFFKGKGNNLNRQLWLRFFDKIRRSNIPRMEPKIFLKWIIFLLIECQVQYPSNYIDRIISKCKYPDDKQAVLILFEYLTKPQISIDNKMSIIGDVYCLKKAWQNFFRTNLSKLSLNLEGIITNHLQKASWIANSAYQDLENF